MLFTSKEGLAMRRSVGIPLSFLLVLGLFVPVWATQELHPGSRVFFPLWDVSTPNRLTFIILTRDALNEGQSIVPTSVDSSKKWKVLGTGNCIPRGGNGSSSNVNRTDLGGTADHPVFVDDVHLEYYGRSCAGADETVHMSCGDIDLFLLAAGDNPKSKPRRGFANVASEGRGALDVHLITNSTLDRKERKLENSLMGHAIISDLAEGWAAVYAGAAAQAVPCSNCASIDGGTEVGYENYPMEVYLPWSFADLWPAPGGTFRNILALWGPGLLPGDHLSATTLSVIWKWWDGRERHRTGSIGAHSIIRPLGGPAITGLDPPLDSSGFVATNFTCSTAAGGPGFSGKAENDGFPRRNNRGKASGTGCNPGSIASPDPDHPSDNFESVGDINVVGHSIQPSTSIGWWRFQLRRDNEPPPLEIPGVDPSVIDHSGRGLVGVLLSTTDAPAFAVGDSWRLWHKAPCQLAQSADTRSPLHAGPLVATELVSLFNIYEFKTQTAICNPVPLPN
jgi:hypothetical protein